MQISKISVTLISFLLRDLRIPQPHATLLLFDNLSTVYLSTNPTLHKRSKHFDTDYHYIREQVALRLIETRHIRASLQVDDIFTISSEEVVCWVKVQIWSWSFSHLKFEGKCKPNG